LQFRIKHGVIGAVLKEGVDMVFITGDIHGSIEPVYDLYVRHQPKPDDVIVLLGDVGVNYTGKMRDRLLKQEMNEMNVTFFCIPRR
jgi:3-oxoacid CoA-transferase subunit A